MVTRAERHIHLPHTLFRLWLGCRPAIGAHSELIEVARTNSVLCGLAGDAFTNRAVYLDRKIDKVKVGNLWINTLEAPMLAPFRRFETQRVLARGWLWGVTII